MPWLPFVCGAPCIADKVIFGFIRPGPVPAGAGLALGGDPGSPPGNFIPRLSAIDNGLFEGPLAPAAGIAGDELVDIAPGRCNCGGSLNPDGKPVAGGAGDAAGADDPPAPGVMEFVRLACGGGAFWREMRNACIFAAISAGNCVVPPLAPPAIEFAVASGGLPRAAFRWPSGVEEGVIFETVEVALMSEVVLGDVMRWIVFGLPKGGDASSVSGVDSGEVGGEGESSGNGWSSGGEAMVVKEGTAQSYAWW